MGSRLSVTEPPSPSEEPENPPYRPTPADVLKVKSIFITRKLPVEIVDLIIDSAEYWLHSSVSLSPGNSADSLAIIGTNANENTFLLRSDPLAFARPDGKASKVEGKFGGYFTEIPHPDPILRENSCEILDGLANFWNQKLQTRREFPCRKIVFTLKSHDQGWGGTAQDRGTYNGSFTWFDVGKERLSLYAQKENVQSYNEPSNSSLYGPQTISAPIVSQLLEAYLSSNFFTRSSEELIYYAVKQTVIPEVEIDSNTTLPTPDDPPRTVKKFKHPLLPDQNVLQKNVTSQRSTKTHTIVWSWDDHIDPESAAANRLVEQGRGSATANGDFVRNLRAGDIVTVWGKARFPGWINHITEVKIDTYWAM